MRKTIIVFLAGAMALAPIFIAPAFSQTSGELETELEQIQAQITEYENELSKTKTEKQTLANKISRLKKEQEKILEVKEVGFEELQDFINDPALDLPELRRDISKPENVGWLVRNLKIRNVEKVPEKYFKALAKQLKK